MRYECRNENQLEFIGIEEYPNLPSFEEPKDDNERFCNYQRDWLLNKNPKAWAKMWSLMEILAQKACTIELHRRHIRIDEEARDIIVGNTITVLLGRYKRLYGYYYRYIVTAIKNEMFKQISNRNDEYERVLLNLLNDREISLTEAEVYVITHPEIVKKAEQNQIVQLWLDWS